MNATSKLLKHRFNPHIKLSKTSLNNNNNNNNNKKCKAFKIQNTHTLNKFNQIYISKTSQDSLMSIH